MEATYGNFEGFYGQYGEKFLPAIVASLICAIVVFAWRSTEGMLVCPRLYLDLTLIKPKKRNKNFTL